MSPTIDRQEACKVTAEPMLLDVIRLKRSGHPGWHLLSVEGWTSKDHNPDAPWRRFLPALAFPPAEEAGWDMLWQDAERLVPDTSVVFGPVLDGFADYRIREAQAERLPGLLMVDMSRRYPGPLSLLWHEAAHELADRLTWDELAAVRVHGDALRQAFTNDLHPDRRLWADWIAARHDWMARDGEAEAWAFQSWSAGDGLDPATTGYADAEKVWKRMRDGLIGRQEKRRGL
jgi:hypothetical protein